MKVFATIEFISLLIWVIAWGREVYYRHDYDTIDGGWTISYRYNAKIRQQAYNASFFALSLAIVGVLILIWTW